MQLGMKLLLTQFACFILLTAGDMPTAGAQGSACDSQAPDPYFYIEDSVARWTFAAEALWLQRVNQPFVTAADTVGDNLDEVFAGAQFRPGVRFELQRWECDGNSWELSYFSLQQWSENATVAGDPVAFSRVVQSPLQRLDDLIGGFDTNVSCTYRAQTHNAEFNRWWAKSDNGIWNVRGMLGARYFNFEERLGLNGVDSTFGSEKLDAAAFNDLIGGQCGARIERKWDRLSLYTVGKVGLFGNLWREQRQDIVLPNAGFPPPDVNSQSQGCGLSGLLEEVFGGRYALTDRVALRCSYNLIYVPGLALPSAAVAVDDYRQASLLLHGAAVGCEFSW